MRELASKYSVAEIISFCDVGRVVCAAEIQGEILASENVRGSALCFAEIAEIPCCEWLLAEILGVLVHQEG